jgi:ABC-type uncharacterized transport system substrate-binding protein
MAFLPLTKIDVRLNKTTAKEIGLTIPEPVLKSANEIVQ